MSTKLLHKEKSLRYNKEKWVKGEKTMKSKTRSNVYLIVSMLVIIALVASTYLFSSAVSTFSGYGRAKEGKLDLTGARIYKISRIFLRGEWQQYEGKWLVSENNTTDKFSYVSLPTNFINSIDNALAPLGDHSTYVIYISGLELENALIYIPHFAGSYRIYINRELVTESGEFYETSTRSDLVTNSLPYDLKADETYEIAIEVSCNYMPGMYMTPAISEAGFASSFSTFATTLRFVIFGGVAFGGILYFLLMLSKRQIFDSKWLPLLFLVISLRLLISTDGYSGFSFLNANVDYEQMMLLVCASTFIIKLIALLFYSETLDIDLSQKTVGPFCAIFTLLAVLFGLVPRVVYVPFFNMLVMAATVTLDIILLGYFARAIAEKKKYAKFYTAGYISLTAGMLIDSFYMDGTIPLVMTASILPLFSGFFALVFSMVFIFKIISYYDAALKTAELDRQLAEANSAIMVSQIQPHFLYNALNTIKYLIKRKPATAEKAIVAFSKYLRGNMNSLTQKEPIPFEEELSHTENYCAIELLRFEDRLNIQYDIRERGFKLPALSVQPLVENAIKHGVTKKIEGGTVKLSTYSDDDFYIVEVTDDGIGFDPSKPLDAPDEKHSHVGLKNVKERLMLMSNATLNVESEVGKGTKAVIKIPRTEENENEGSNS